MSHPSLGDLARLIQALSSAVNALESQTAQTPEGVQHFLTDRLGDACRDAAGWLLEARRQADKMISRSHSADTESRRQQRLQKVQDLFEKARRQIDDHICSDTVLQDFRDLAKRKPELWSEWVRGVKRQQMCIQRLSYEMLKSLTTCWQQMAQHPPVEVQIRTVAIRRH
jgi:Sec-independent protein translocase protein TatA